MQDWEIVKKKIKDHCRKIKKLQIATLNAEELTQYYYISTYPIDIFERMDEGKMVDGINNNDATLIEVAKVAKKCHQLIEKIGKQMKKFALSKNEWGVIFDTIAESYNDFLQNS
jgi:hypothetical protein